MRMHLGCSLWSFTSQVPFNYAAHYSHDFRSLCLSFVCMLILIVAGEALNTQCVKIGQILIKDITSPRTPGRSMNFPHGQWRPSVQKGSSSAFHEILSASSKTPFSNPFCKLKQINETAILEDNSFHTSFLSHFQGLTEIPFSSEIIHSLNGTFNEIIELI